VSLESRDQGLYDAWHSHRTVLLLRFSLLLGAVLYTANTFLDRLVDADTAAKLLPQRGLVALVLLAFGWLTFASFARRNPDFLLFVLIGLLSAANTVITGELGAYAGFNMAAGQLVMGIFLVIISRRFRTLAVLTAILFAAPLVTYALLGRMPEDAPAAYVVLASGCVAIVLLSYLHEQEARRSFRLARELERAATTDALTEMPNRAAILETAATELERAARFGHPLSTLMVDIDHFKMINDRHGHAVGDMVLKAVAETCAAAVRTFDHVGRLGGEEFLIVLGESDEHQARAAAERVREAVEALSVASIRGPLSVTVSLGVATTRSPDESLDLLLNRADQALYRAKAEGRNRVAA